MKNINAKPFIQWAGGKTQLIEQIESKLPADFDSWEDVTYIEPFVGGGAMFFHMLQKHPNIKHAVINDINPDLVICYKTVRDKTEELIKSLKKIQEEYFALQSMEEKQAMYLNVRNQFNEKTSFDPIGRTSQFFFLNRTCYNALYRVNKKGFFNVHFGKKLNPQFFNEKTLRADSLMLKNVEILEGDFENTLHYAKNKSFFYFDPPYRPLSGTSNFNEYAKENFDDNSQIRLKEFCDQIVKEGHSFMLSNSDCKGKNEEDTFFDDLYANYYIDRVYASRSLNSDASKRGKITELLIRSYPNVKKCYNLFT